MPWLFGAVPPLVIFHSSQGEAQRQQRVALRAALLCCMQLPQEQRHAVGSAGLPASLGPVQESLASPQHPGKKRFPGAISSGKQNPLSILNGNSAWGRWKLTVFLFPLVSSPLWVLFHSLSPSPAPPSSSSSCPLPLCTSPALFTPVFGLRQTT